MKISTKIAYNTIIQVISKVIATILGLVAIALITRYLGQYGYGQYTTIVTFLTFFGIIADLGLTLVTVQMISQPVILARRKGKEAGNGNNGNETTEQKISQDKILGNLLALRLVSAIIFLGLAPLIVLFFPYDPIIKIGVAVTSFSFLFIALNQILVGLFQKHLRMDKVSIAEVVSRLALVVGIFIIVKLDYGLFGVMIITVVSSLVSFVLHYLFSRTLARIKLCFDPKLWREIMSRSWPLAITIVLNLAYLKTDTLLLSVLSRESDIGIIAEVGLYGAAYKVIDVLITFPFMFAGIILPLLTLSWAENNTESFKKILQKSFDVMVILAMPIAIGSQFLARDMMVLVAGEEFAASGSILQVLIFAAVFIFLGSMFAHAVIAINKQKKIIPAYFFVAATAVAGYFIFIPRFSYLGAAWVTIYSEVAIAIASVYIVYKYARFFPNILIIVKTLAAAGVMAGALYACRVFDINSLLITLPAAVFVYFGFLFLFRGLSKEDLLTLFPR